MRVILPYTKFTKQLSLIRKPTLMLYFHLVYKMDYKAYRRMHYVIFETSERNGIVHVIVVLLNS